VLGRYVRDRAALSLPDAVRKLTSVPAERLGLRDRGRLAEGLAADVVAFRADTVIDKATFLNPCQPPLGIDYVVVNGRLVVDQGHQTNELPGVVLRRT
jgi:N-acyl-D-aspartate/D-glutamate deacylase